MKKKNQPESWSNTFKYSLAFAALLIVLLNIYVGVVFFAGFWLIIALVRNIRGKI